MFLESRWKGLAQSDALGHAVDRALRYGLQLRPFMGPATLRRRSVFKDVRGRFLLRNQPVLERGRRRPAIGNAGSDGIAHVATRLRKLLTPRTARGKEPAHGPRQVVRFVHLKDRQHAPGVRPRRLHNFFRQSEYAWLIRYQQKFKT